jgi:hypothetical protein
MPKNRPIAYTRAQDGDWIQPRKRGYRMTCCDCGLVHRLNFRIKDGKIQYQPFRDPEETRKRRRAISRPRK